MCTSAEVLFFSWLKAKKQLQQQKLLFLNNILVILIVVSRLFKNKRWGTISLLSFGDSVAVRPLW